MSAGARITQTCLACGRSFLARERDVARGRREGRPLGRTCSLSCANRLRHRSRPTLRLTKAQRREIRAVQAHRCAQCHAKGTPPSPLQLVVVVRPDLAEPDPSLPGHHVALCQVCANRFAAKLIDPEHFKPMGKGESA